MILQGKAFICLGMLAVILVAIAFLMPILGSAFSETDTCGLLTNNVYGFIPAYLKSCSFAVLSAILCAVGGLQLALFMRDISLRSKMGYAMSLLFLPMALGNMTVAYLSKCSFYGTSFFNSVIQGGYWSQTLLMLVVQFWQYGLMFTYLFWLGIQMIPDKLHDFSKATGMSDKEKIKDTILPSVKNLFILLFFIAFIFSFYESAKSQLVFKASQGVGTEMVNQALHRIYLMYSIVSPSLAGVTVFKAGCMVAFFTMVMVGFCGLCIFGFYSVLLKNSTFIFSSKKSRLVAPICILCVMGLIVIGLSNSKFCVNYGTLGEMLLPMALTFVAAICATVYVVLFGIASKLLFPSTLDGFKIGSLSYLLAGFLLQLFPPICLMVCGYGWLSVIGYNRGLIYIVWIVGHMLLVFPILGSFVVASHFAVRNEELEWQIVHGVSEKRIVLYSFVKRFKAEYILTFLFAYTMIWNDMTVNTILSDFIPSFADKMQRLFIGRATDDAKATLFALLSIFIASGCVYVWTLVVKKNYANG